MQRWEGLCPSWDKIREMLKSSLHHLLFFAMSWFCFLAYAQKMKYSFQCLEIVNRNAGIIKQVESNNLYKSRYQKIENQIRDEGMSKDSMKLSQCLKFTEALDQHGEIIFDCDSVQLKWLMTKCMTYPPNQMQHQVLLHTRQIVFAPENCKMRDLFLKNEDICKVKRTQYQYLEFDQ